MKKTLVALAIAGAFTGAAYAQSSVTLYGIADIGYTSSDPKAGTATNQDATRGINGGTLAGNRWGLRGAEDLGGGLKAVFQLESGFNIDTGTSGQGGRLFGRQAYAGLTGGFGGIVAGRLATFASGTGAFDKFGSLDPFRTGYGSLGIQATMGSSAAVRFDNAIAYVTPNLGGFSAGVGYTTRVAGSELAGGNDTNNAGFISYANFAAGPFYAVVTYDSVKLGEVAGDPTEKHLQAGASYDLKFVKLSVAYADEKNQYALFPVDIQSGAQAPGADSQAWMVGAVVPFGPHRIAASYQHRKTDGEAGVGDGKRDVYAIGYEYSFSKRTTGYVAFGEIRDKDAYKTANWGGTQQWFIGLNHAF